MAKLVEFTETGGPENLHLVERDIPAPAADEVQVEIKCTGLNRAELMFLAGQYLVVPPSPSKIGVEASGIIRAVGGQVSGFKPGDGVSITPNLNPTQYGVLGEIVNVPASALQRKPEDVSFTDAAAFWMAYPTAWGGMVQAGGLRAGADQVVVIPAASSSVGIAAIQIAKAHGATVIAVTRTRDKVADIQRVGPDQVIITGEQDLVSQVKEITDGKGFDLAFDPVGGSFVETLAHAAGRDGMIIEYGLLSGQSAALPFFAMIGKGLAIKTFHLVFDLMQQPARLEKAVDHLLPLWADGTYKPIIDGVFPLAQAQEAYGRLVPLRINT